jgi:trehalose-phosphatase
VTPYLERNEIKVETGKKVLEVKPSSVWVKGRAVLWLLSRQKTMYPHKRILPIYVGDDSTDENAFVAVKNIGLSVFIGNPRKSHAQYYLKNTKEVLAFLTRLHTLLPK